MPKILAGQIADMVSDAKSDEELRQTLRVGITSATQYGFNHGNPAFWSALCEAMQRRIDTEQDAQRKQRLQAAYDLICRVRDKKETV